MWKDHEPAVSLVAGDFYNTNFFSDGSTAAIAKRDKSKPFWLHLMHQAVHTGDHRSPPAWEQWHGPGPGVGAVSDYQSALHVLDTGIGNLTASLQTHDMWSNTIFGENARQPIKLFFCASFPYHRCCRLPSVHVWHWTPRKESCIHDPATACLSIVLSADNGGDCGYMSGYASNFPLLGRKCQSYDGGTRTAAFVAGGLIPPALHGTTNDGLFHVADWYATLTRLAGVDATDDW